MRREVLSFVRNNATLFDVASSFESWMLRSRLPEITKPIFVCGLARAGTTVVTQLLNQHSSTGSLLYKDLPFLEVPYFWSFVQNGYYGKQGSTERPHGDGLHVHPESPDAFEELLWRRHLSEYDSGGFFRLLDVCPCEDALRMLIQKVLLIRKSSRYLSKGNYNLFRIPAILEVFPDAKILICLRDPFDHAQSLARVHKRFCAMADGDPGFSKELALLGHFEFGPARKPIDLLGGNVKKTVGHWEKGEDYEGYLLQWLDVYRYVLESHKDALNVQILSHEKLLEDPASTIDAALKFCDLPMEEIDTSALRGRSSYDRTVTEYDADVEEVYAEFGL